MGEEKSASECTIEPDQRQDQTTPKSSRQRSTPPPCPTSPLGHRVTGKIIELQLNRKAPYPVHSQKSAHIRSRSRSRSSVSPADVYLEPEPIVFDVFDAPNTLTYPPVAENIAGVITTLVAEWITAKNQGLLPPNLAEILGDSGVMLAELLKEAGILAEDGTTGMDKGTLKEENPILNRLTSIRESMIEDRKAVNIRLARIEQQFHIGTATSAPTPNWAADTYATRANAAPATAATAKLKNPKPTVTKQPTKTLSKHERDRPSRFVVHFGETVQEHERADSYSIVKETNSWIKLCSDAEVRKTLIATAKWNAHGNLVLTVIQGQSAKTLEPYFLDLHYCYTLRNVIPQKTTLDEKWNKLIVDGVPTGAKWRFAKDLGTKPFDSDELQAELMLYNPSLTDITFAAAPRFLVPPSDLAAKAESSITFAIFNKDIADEILTERYLNLFGKACRVREYQDRTPAKPQCQKCKRFGHVGEHCKFERRCGMCGDAHTEAEHTLQCLACRANPRYANAEFSERSLKEGTISSCSHNLCCVNCKEKNLPFDHRADNRECPERTRQMGSVRDNNRAPDTGKVASSQPTRRRKKAAKAQHKDTPQLGVVSSNSFAVLGSEASGSTHSVENDDDLMTGPHD